MKSKKNSLSLLIGLIFLFFILPFILHAQRGGSSGGFSAPAPSSPARGGSHYGGGGDGLEYLIFYLMHAGGPRAIPVVVVGGIIFMVARSVIAAKKRQAAEGFGSQKIKSSLIHLQVGLFYGEGQLEEDLLRVSRQVNTGTHAGLVTLLRETSFILKRNTPSLRWFYFNKENFNSPQSLESNFRSLVASERSKIEEEEFLSTDGTLIDKKTQKDNLEEVIVLSVVAATGVDFMLSKDNTFENLEKLIGFLASIPDSQVLGVNVVWNIADRDMLLEKFPRLRSV